MSFLCLFILVVLCELSTLLNNFYEDACCFPIIKTVRHMYIHKQLYMEYIYNYMYIIVIYDIHIYVCVCIHCVYIYAHTVMCVHIYTHSYIYIWELYVLCVCVCVCHTVIYIYVYTYMAYICVYVWSLSNWSKKLIHFFCYVILLTSCISNFFYPRMEYLLVPL